MTLRDVGLLKICLCAIGVIIGVAVKPSHKKHALIGASVVFAVTYSLLIPRFIRTLLEEIKAKSALE